MSLEDERYCVIDLETTGLNTRKDEIIAISAIPIEGMRMRLSKAFFTLVSSERVEAKSIKYHGITKSDLQDAPHFEEVAPKVLELLESSIVVGYATSMDVEFLKRAFRKKMGIKLKVDRYVDILEIEVWLTRKKGMAVTYRLDFDALIKMHGVERLYRHSALGDAYATGLIFLKQLSQLLDYRVSVVELIRIGRRIML